MTRLGEEDLEALRRDGIVLKPAFFSAQEAALIRSTSLRLRPLSRPHAKPSRMWLLLSPSYAFWKCLRPALRRDIVFLSDVALERGFRDFARRYYAQDVHLDHIISIESPRSDEAITAWHTDANFKADDLRPPDRFTLKFFIYLNDVDASNGAFSYARGTHRLVTALREGFFRRRLSHFWTGRFPDIKTGLKSADAVKWVRETAGQDALDAFENAASRTGDGEKGSDKDYLCGPAGTLVIFDDRGIHRGGIPREKERSILRYNYIPSIYWVKQFTPFRYAVNRALTALLPQAVAAHW